MYAVRHQRNMRIHLVVAVGVLVAGGPARSHQARDGRRLGGRHVRVGDGAHQQRRGGCSGHAHRPVRSARQGGQRSGRGRRAGGRGQLSGGRLSGAWSIVSPSSTLRVVKAIRQSSTSSDLVAFASGHGRGDRLKATRKKGTPLSGGMPSGHAALAFAGWTVITFVVGKTREGLLASMIALVMALLVAQSRVETGIHSLLEVRTGGVSGGSGHHADIPAGILEGRPDRMDEDRLSPDLGRLIDQAKGAARLLGVEHPAIEAVALLGRRRAISSRARRCTTGSRRRLCPAAVARSTFSRSPGPRAGSEAGAGEVLGGGGRGSVQPGRDGASECWPRTSVCEARSGAAADSQAARAVGNAAGIEGQPRLLRPAGAAAGGLSGDTTHCQKGRPARRAPAIEARGVRARGFRRRPACGSTTSR